MDDGLERFRSDLTAHLDWFAERGRKVRFWWRDDDARRADGGSGPAAVDRERTRCRRGARRDSEGMPHRPWPTGWRTNRTPVVLQHGWQHKNFQRKDLGEGAAELGTRRDPDQLLGETGGGQGKA